MENPIIIVGGGISGLSLGLFLLEKGKDAIILERNSHPGGIINTYNSGDFSFDFGANSSLEYTKEVKELTRILNLESRILHGNINEAGKYYTNQDTIHKLSHPVGAMLPSLISFRTTLVNMMSHDSDDNNQYKQALNRINGTSELISSGILGSEIKSPDFKTISKLHKWAERSLDTMYSQSSSVADMSAIMQQENSVKQIISFPSGISKLVRTAESRLSKRILCDADVTKVSANGNGYTIEFLMGTKSCSMPASKIIFTCPAYSTESILKRLNPLQNLGLEHIKYPPMAGLTLMYPKKNVKLELDKFGFLIPDLRNEYIVGTYWNTDTFEDLVPDDNIVFTIFIHAWRLKGFGVFERDKFISKAQQEFERLFHISGKPVVKRYVFWKKGLPVYETDHTKIMGNLMEFETSNPGLYITGSYRGGFSLSQCIRQSHRLADTIAKLS